MEASPAMMQPYTSHAAQELEQHERRAAMQRSWCSDAPTSTGGSTHNGNEKGKQQEVVGPHFIKEVFRGFQEEQQPIERGQEAGIEERKQEDIREEVFGEEESGEEVFRKEEHGPQVQQERRQAGEARDA
jgi:hypothetical protein